MAKKYLIITGGSRGIGEATVKRFQQADFIAINLSRTKCMLPQVQNFYLDLNNLNDIESSLQKISNIIIEKSHIVLVHNAAFYLPDTLSDLNLADLQTTLSVNLIAPVLINQFFIPKMDKNSAITYVGTTLSEKAVPGSASYIISKHALIGLMRVTCQDLIQEGIRANCVCPGLVNTELLKQTMNQSTLDYLLKEKIIGKRLIEPTEIAEVIYFCSTSLILNGVILHANLGQIAE